MPDHTVSRRTVAIALAGGALGAKLASADSSEQPRGELDDATGAPVERALLSPLVEGSRVLSWEVVAIGRVEHGAVRVSLRGQDGASFGVEILARDRSPIAPRPPARSERFALHVSNGGDGRSPTAEEQGLAAMALVQIVARNEERVSLDGFLTHSERIAAHRSALLEHAPPTIDPPAKRA